MAKHKRRGAGVVVGLALIGLAVPAAPASSSDPDDDNSFTLTEDSEATFAGSYSDADAVVSFVATELSPARAEVEVVVNGVTIVAQRDLDAGTAEWGGGGAVLSRDELDSVQRLYEALVPRWRLAVEEDRGVDGKEDLTIRLLALVSEAPLGLPFSDQVVSRPVVTVLDDDEGNAGVLDWEQVDPHDSALTLEASLYACEATARSAPGRMHVQAALSACQVNNDNGVIYFPCTKMLRYLNHDSNGHCFLAENVWTGPGSSNCMGECGPGCNGLNFYTQDCGDHDRFGRVHGGSLNPLDGECDDEYRDADDDFFLGWPKC